jgi:hypothetical protein
MSQEKVEIVRRGWEAWMMRDVDARQKALESAGLMN